MAEETTPFFDSGLPVSGLWAPDLLFEGRCEGEEQVARRNGPRASYPPW